jgi:hypothetical protein
MKIYAFLLLLPVALSCAQIVSTPNPMQWFAYPDYSIGVSKLHRPAQGPATTDLSLQLHGARESFGRVEFSAILYEDVNLDRTYQAAEMRSRRDASWSDPATRVTLPEVSFPISMGSPWVQFRIKTSLGEQVHQIKVPQ